MNNTQVDGAHDIDIVMPMYNLIEYSYHYLKKSGILWQYYRDEPYIIQAYDKIADFIADNTITDSFRIKEKITSQTSDNGEKDVEIMVPLKYLSNFWRTL